MATNTRSARAEVLAQLLERHDELVSPIIGANGEKGDGDSVPLPPGTYTRDVKELERLLRRMRSEERRLWWHLTERYIRSTTVLRDDRVTRKTKKGTMTELVRVVKAVIHPKVDHDLVEAGLEWLAHEWGLGREPMLPTECLVSEPVRGEP